MLQNFSYNNTVIQRREDGFINLTQMCNANGKRIDHWKELKSTGAYINALQVNYPGSRVVETEEGANGGTWGHPSLAINLARWISPEFAVWCDGHIFCLMETGKTELAQQPKAQIQPDQLLSLIDQVFANVPIKPELVAGIKLNAVVEIAPAIAPHALNEARQLLIVNTAQPHGLLTATQIGKELGLSGQAINKLLIEKGLQVKNENRNSSKEPAYLPTVKGSEFADLTLATGSNSSSTFQQLRWYKSVVSALQ